MRQTTVSHQYRTHQREPEKSDVISLQALSEEYVCRCVDLSLSYDGKPILNRVSLQVGRGEVVSLIGPSGAGKSSLLKMIALLERPDDGRIYLNGKEVGYAVGWRGTRRRCSEQELSKQRLAIGMVFQAFNLFPHLTVLENAMLGPRRVLKLGREESERLAVEQLKRVGLSGHMHSFPSTLSGGQQQRAAIARALARSPDLMLFDEPTSALDPELVEEVLRVIAQLAVDGMSMIVVTHQLDLVRRVSDRILMMDAGRVIEEGPPSQILDNPTNGVTNRFVSVA